MDVGSLRHLIVIERRTEAQDSTYGAIKPEWVVFFECWAEIKALTGIERPYADQTLATATHQVRIRWAPGINAKMRVRFGTRLLNITDVNNTDERNIELLLFCTEEV